MGEQTPEAGSDLAARFARWDALKRTPTTLARTTQPRTSQVGVSPCHVAAIAIKCALRLTPSFAPRASHT